MVLGSSIATWRPERSSGNTFADGWSEPFLQNAGLAGPRTAAASHRRPRLSSIELWLLARVSQIASSPQYAEACIGLSAAAWPGPSESGMAGSCTGSLKNVTWWVFGSRIGMLSVLYSGAP